MIGWNLELGTTTTIKENVDMDPQQVYEDQDGGVYYGDEAREQVQKDWEEAYESKNYDPNYKKKIDTELIMKTLTDEEIIEAINKTGAKGIAWDCITTWSLKMISQTTTPELMRLADSQGTNLVDINLD